MMDSQHQAPMISQSREMSSANCPEPPRKSAGPAYTLSLNACNLRTEKVGSPPFGSCSVFVSS